MKFTPYIIGSGMAGQAMAHALRWVAAAHGWEMDEPAQVARDQVLEDAEEGAIFCIANPHRLHIERLRQVRNLPGAVICEKPAAVTLEDIDELADYGKDVAVCHGYRMHWGPQAIRQYVDAGELGEIITIEGRYWQSSATSPAKKTGWKSDTELNGGFDTLMDLATHWLDMACYLRDDFGPQVAVRLSHVNAPDRHRDTHVLMDVDWDTTAGTASISKTAHGWGNHFEVHVLGAKGSLGWEFSNPDGLWLGREGTRCWVPRGEPASSGLPPFHGLGWLEGYVTIIESVMQKMQGAPAMQVPTLEESLAVTRALINAAA